MLRPFSIALTLLCAAFALGNDKPKFADLINKKKDIAPASLTKSSEVTKFKPTPGRVAVKGFVADL
ncbi:MAG: hypothetical protein MUC92_13925, partial [Fimbriimonadaceae bacterium]|nr:hypothetical protein [Fimbriimonadaceae bacterium]